MSEKIFKRKAYQKMLDWKRESAGKTALLVEGARRIGKSTLVRQFAENEYKSYILIDFANVVPEVNRLIESSIADLDYLFVRLQLIYHVTLERRKSVIIFDEVQLQPLARQAIKYLVQDGRYDYIETGSLISIRQNVQHIVIPSEEERIQMYPMDYEEFRWAMGDEATIPLLGQVMKSRMPLGVDVHRRMMRDFRLYMLVGGMPQAVNEFLDTQNLQMVDNVKRRILKLYADDLHKLDSSDKLRELYWAVPSELSKNASRYQVTTVIENTKQERKQELLEMMRESMIVNIAYQASDPNVGLALTADKTRYKMYLADTGLFVTLAFWDKDFTENVIYEKLLSDKLKANLGYVYENVVAQMLKASGNELYYHTFPSQNKHNYEVDFLLSRGNKILPIEVKSSNYLSHKSLDEFVKKYSSRVTDRIMLYTKDYQKDGATLCLPVYFTPML
ncbi:MAG: ATP-binding protein [Bacteroidales bacterium]|nr:ATP-binding protein [Bacteroidales bacterium]